MTFYDLQIEDQMIPADTDTPQGPNNNSGNSQITEIIKGKVDQIDALLVDLKKSAMSMKNKMKRDRLQQQSHQSIVDNHIIEVAKYKTNIAKSDSD